MLTLGSTPESGMGRWDLADKTRVSSEIEALRPLEKRALGAASFGAIYRFVMRKPLGAVAGMVLILLLLTAVFAPQVAPHDPLQAFYRHSLKPPSLTARPGMERPFLFGTDQIGRDVFSRIIFGARVSLTVGFGAVSLGVTVGTVWGLISGYFGGKVDLIIQRFMDAIQTVPALLVAMVLVAMLGGSVFNVILAIGFIQQARANRVVRGSVLSVKQNAFVEAATAMGASHRRIMLRHVLPNILAPLVIIISVDLGAAILIEASLSFLGVGIAPPTPTWGGMLSAEGRAFLERAPWMGIFPGVAISLVVLAFNLLGDSLRDILDPRLRT